MTRDIKFRFWDGTRGNMAMCYQDDDGRFKYPSSGFTLDFHQAWTEANTSEGYDKPKALMEWTGLKDKNGREIYEGDIVSFFDWQYWSRGQEWQQHSNKYHGKSSKPVVFEDGCFVSCAGYEYYNSLGDIAQDKGAKLEVIGNIYENPELLEANPASS